MDNIAAIQYPHWLEFNENIDLRDLDLAFGRFLFRFNRNRDLLAIRLAVLCSYVLQQGNTNLDLEELYQNPSQLLPAEWLINDKWPEFLPKDLTACVALIEQADFIGDGNGSEPIIFEANRLYMARFWHASKDIFANIYNLLNQSYKFTQPEIDTIKNLLDQVFANSNDFTDWQKIACATALLSNFTVITGGPGTGKTTTVVSLLAVIQALAINADLPNGARIQLAAPTGKAAARLNESIAGAINRLADLPDALIRRAAAHIPSTVVTLHSLLGTVPNSRSFKHNQANRLELDILVVDEASMIDIEIFAAVLQALPDHARLILLGDKDQLASVEAGAILGELCARSQAGYYTRAHCDLIEMLSGETIDNEYIDANGSVLDQAVVMLRHSYRFHHDSGIGQLADAINNSDLTVLDQLLASKTHGLDFITIQQPGDKWLDLLFHANAYPHLFKLIHDFDCRGASRAELDQWALAVLRQQSYLQVLCVLREGRWGVSGINNLIELSLKSRSLIPKYARGWYVGRPIIILKNRPDLGLANGDIGICLPVPDALDPTRIVYRVAFLATEPNQVRWLSPARLAEVETVYALTVHKSQGSEFNHVIMVLPDKLNPVLSRELLYTGVTRAKDRFSLVMPGGVDVFLQAAQQQINRSKSILI